MVLAAQPYEKIGPLVPLTIAKDSTGRHVQIAKVQSRTYGPIRSYSALRLDINNKPHVLPKNTKGGFITLPGDKIMVALK
jgi:hypothetical protein